MVVHQDGCPLPRHPTAASGCQAPRRQVLAGRGAGEEILDAVLAVSELVTNAANSPR